MSSPEKILREPVQEACLAIARSLSVPETYVAEYVAGILDTDLALDIVCRHLANELRVLFGARKLDLSEPDGVAEESMMEYLRRTQG